MPDHGPLPDGKWWGCTQPERPTGDGEKLLWQCGKCRMRARLVFEAEGERLCDVNVTSLPGAMSLSDVLAAWGGDA